MIICLISGLRVSDADNMMRRKRKRRMVVMVSNRVSRVPEIMTDIICVIVSASQGNPMILLLSSFRVQKWRFGVAG